jgi:hypothetical protein
MAASTTAGRRRVPIVAAALAVAYLLAALLVPAALGPFTIAAVLAGCAVVVTRRPSRELVVSITAIGIWLLMTFAGAWLLRGEPRNGLLWVLLAIFVLPLPLVPWLYAATFSSAHGSRPTAHASPATPTDEASPE